MIGNMYKLNEKIKSGNVDFDIVLVCDEGIASRNREIIVPALLELNKIPYIGSDAYAMGLSQNKYHTELIARSLGIRFPKGIYLEYSENAEPDEADIMEQLAGQNLDFPLIVKPNEEGYSMGVFLCRNKEDLMKAILFDFQNYKEAVLIQEFIDGKELFVPMIGTGEETYALPIGRVAADVGGDVELYSVEDKCLDWSHYEAYSLPDDITKQMQEESLKLYRHMNCRDFGRSDYRLMKDGTPVMIEITPRPGLTEEGPFESCAKAAGKSYDMILKEIIDSAAKRYGLI
jgi:D-alanine-D-alanine ligase